MGSRGSRASVSVGAALSGTAIVALVLAACGGSASTPGASGASVLPGESGVPPSGSAQPGSPGSSLPTETPPPTPTPLPSAEAGYQVQATRIVEALGGQVPPGTIAAVTYGDVVNGSPSVHVALGDWQLAWDSKHVLRHVFWDQSADGDTPPPTADLSREAIRTRLDGYVAALGLNVGAPSALDAEGEAWLADWPRFANGVLVEENGTRLWLNKDGTFLQYTYGWNDLAARPAKTITAAQAIGAVDDCKAGASSPGPCQAWLVWHLPSSAAIEDPLVLCWKVAPMNSADGDWVVWVDAGTGKIVDVAAALD